MIIAAQYRVEKIEFAKLRDLVQIGEGGFGEVYWAKHIDWGPVAYKRLLVTFIREHDRCGFEIDLLLHELCSARYITWPCVLSLIHI